MEPMDVEHKPQAIEVFVYYVWADSRTAWVSGLFFRNQSCTQNTRRSHVFCRDSVDKRRTAKNSYAISCSVSLDKERSFCLQAARQVRNIYNKMPHLQAFMKDDLSPVTAIDVAIQGTLFKELSRAFSHDALVAEEDIAGLIADSAFLHTVEQLVDFSFENLCLDSSPKRSTRWWTLDPIDGTKGLLTGGDFAVGLALQHSENRAGYPVLGSLILPRQGVLLLADVPASRLEIIPLNHLSSAEALFDGSFTKSDEDTTSTKNWHFSGGKDFFLEGCGPWKPLCCGSLVKYAAVAQGTAFALIQTLPFGFAYSWDHAAGIAAVRASGGMVTDEYGNDFAVGSDKDLRLVQLEQGSKAIVASGRGIDHSSLCSKVRHALQYSFR